MKKNIVKVNKQRCKNCELCLPECKPQIIAVSNETNSMGYHPIYITEMDKCIGCTLCAVTCPEGAIEVFREEDQE